MSNGNPKKFKSFEDLAKELNINESLKSEGDSTRVYKKKGARVQKELEFTIKGNKSKLT